MCGAGYNLFQIRVKKRNVKSAPGKMALIRTSENFASQIRM